MKKLTKIFFLFSIILFTVLTRRAVSSDSFSKIISGSNEKFLLIETMSANVTRLSKKGNATVEEEWNYYYKKPDKILVEYLKPHKRFLSLNNLRFVEYIPDIKKAMVLNLDDMSENEKNDLIKNVFLRVSILGLRPGDVKPGDINIKRAKLDEFDAHFIKSKDPDYQIWIDTKSGALLKHVIFNDKGDVVYSTYGTDFKRFKGDIIVPQKIKLVLPDEKDSNKIVTSEMTLENLKINDGIKDELFTIKLDYDVEIVK